MNRTLRVVTDTATIAMFDPSDRGQLPGGGSGLWDVPLHQVPGVARGDMALVSVGSDGIYRVRVTDEGLTGAERAYASEVVHGLGVRTNSGALAIAGAEALSGHEPGAPLDDYCKVKAGAYNVDAYRIDWSDAPQWWREDGVAPEDAPPDLVLSLQPRTSPVPPLAQEPRLGWAVSRSWAFPGEPREVGPMPGMLLTTTVRKGPKGLILKECGPGNYAATLADYSAVEWKDRVRFRVISVDHEAESMVGEFVEKLAPEPRAR